MSKETSAANESLRRVLLLPTLLLCTFLAFTVAWFFSTLLVDVASTFKVSIGTASQLAMVGTAAGVIMGFALSVISIRFKHKSLFLLGIAFYAAGTLSYFFAANFATAVLSQFLVGLGAAMIMAMAYTLIGEQLPLERRGWATGLVISSVMASAVIVATLSGFIASVAGWRSVLLLFIFPLSIFCFALGSVVIPSKQPQLQSATKPSYKQAFKKIFLNRSPIACVVSTLLVAFIGVVPVYAVSFYRIVFSVSPTVGGVFSSIAAAGGMVGGAVGGRLVNRYGRKSIAVTTVFISGICCILFTFIPVIGLSVAVWFIAASTVGMTWAGLPSLTMEQVPDFRASMMSINNSFDNAGTILGVIIGGLILNLFSNFHLLMLILGALGASAAAVLLFGAKDPCKVVSTQ